MKMKTEARVIQDDDGWWHVQLKPVIMGDEGWKTFMFSRDKGDFDHVSARFSGLEMEWVSKEELDAVDT